MRIDGYVEVGVDLKYPLFMDDNKYEKIILREFGGKDEEAFGKDDEAKNNSIYAQIFAIWRCIAEVPGAKRLPSLEEVGFLPYGEIERITVLLRELTLGKVFKSFGVCPKCSKSVEVEITSEEFLVNQEEDYKDIDIVLKRGAYRDGKSLKNAKIRPFSAWSMVELLKSKDTEFSGDSNTRFIYSMVESFDGKEATPEDIAELTKADRSTIISLAKIPQIIKPEVIYECGHCHAETPTRLWVLDFLY